MAKKIAKVAEHNILTPSKKPADMPLVAWQFALRKQFGQGNIFEVKNIGKQPVYSDFDVYNAVTQKHYKVAIRSQDNSLNFCNCNDFKTNGLNTCKHIEYVLHQIRIYPPYHKILLSGYEPAYSSVYLKYGAVREVMIKIGNEERGKFEALARKYFNKDMTLKLESYPMVNSLLIEGKNISNSFRIYEDAMEFIIEYRDNQSRQLMVDKLFPETIPNELLEKRIKNPIKDYQKQTALAMLKAGSSMLSYEIGLGSCEQIICTSELFAELFGVSKIVIFCPDYLKTHWVCKINEVSYSQGHWDSEKSREMELYQIVGFSEIEALANTLEHDSIDLIVIDQADKLLAMPLAIAESIKQIKSKYVIINTLYGIETKVEAIYSLMQYINIFTLGPRYQFIDNHTQVDESGKKIGYKNIHLIKRALSETLISRSIQQFSNQIAEFLEEDIYVSLTKTQYGYYQKYLAQLNKLIARWKTFSNLEELERQQLLATLDKIFKVCADVHLIDSHLTSGIKLEELKYTIANAVSQNTERIVIYTRYRGLAKLVAEYLQSHQIYAGEINAELSNEELQTITQQYNISKTVSILICCDEYSFGYQLSQTNLIVNMDLPLTHTQYLERLSKANTGIGKTSIINILCHGSVEQSLLALYHKRFWTQSKVEQEDNMIFFDKEMLGNFLLAIEKLITTNDVIECLVVDDLQISADIADEVSEHGTGIQLSLLDEVADESQATKIARLEPTTKERKANKIIKKSMIASLEKYIIKDEDGKIYLKIPIEISEEIEDLLHGQE